MLLYYGSGLERSSIHCMGHSLCPCLPALPCGVQTVTDGMQAMGVAIFQCKLLTKQAAGWVALGL